MRILRYTPAHRASRQWLPLVTATLAICLTGCESTQTIDTELVFNPATASSTTSPSTQRPHLSFRDTVFAFDTVSAGRQLRHEFHFINEGPGVALIADVSTTCGCTVPKTWPREPLAEGEEGSIEVWFDTHDKSGEQDKIVRVVGNTDPGVTALHVIGHVVSPK
ncbi:MAG: DUF1573 domain-containing protein [Bacteroidetes bacterium]|nr:DUF1573 domain-containing protein [Bacteroidota bacterium]MDA0904174.1 DUF1573 domain-containing protein [Bacteroidota bacterium]MDA1242924.1 DUF1573 domain-containing protein [Bacteroidota bacterium]